MTMVQTVNSGDPWATCATFARKYKVEELRNLKEEVEKVLIFAGLFSGVVTAFAIESYHGVKEDPAETSVVLLKTIVQQLENITSPQPGNFIDFGLQASPNVRSSQQTNIIWSLSLVLALATAMIGLLCLQWIREYEGSTNLPDREDLTVQFIRHDGFDKWRVPVIVSLLPLFLVISLLLFCAGYTLLLWGVEKSSALPVLVVAGMAACFFIVTTITPGIQFLIIAFLPGYRPSQCPWKSPQSYAILRLISTVERLLRKSRSPLRFRQGLGVHPTTLLQLPSWRKYDYFFLNHGPAQIRTMHLLSGLGWVATMFQHKELTKALSQCLRSLAPADLIDLWRTQKVKLGYTDGEMLNLLVGVENLYEDSEIISPVDTLETEKERAINHSKTAFSPAPERTLSSENSITKEVVFSRSETLHSQHVHDRLLSATGDRLHRLTVKEWIAPRREYLYSRVLDYISTSLGYGHASATLLQLRLEMFWAVNEAGSMLEPSRVLECPVDDANVGFLRREETDKILACIQSRLKEDLDCDDSCFVALLAILGLQARQKRRDWQHLVADTLQNVLRWMNTRSFGEGIIARNTRFKRNDRSNLANKFMWSLRDFCSQEEERIILSRCTHRLKELVIAEEQEIDRRRKVAANRGPASESSTALAITKDALEVLLEFNSARWN
ncbi:hypothetical protein NP233_g6174 [Leucocoprinus birnbaumii]|uniref:DUF6535 domain-containing protein n=1 Tax=Leucocoprinus birnbaumii TaxID=56174 RepID=A0AAD5VRN0_9AGAR|nr:hypothetical protein NP233_g6174 [Leucocoprinus birnbaumii]